MTPTPGITALLRHARLTAIEQHSGEPASFYMLAQLAASIRDVVISQVLVGLWKDFGVTEREHIENLHVECVLRVRAQKIDIEWDFSKTRLPNLVVESDHPSNTGDAS